MVEKIRILYILGSGRCGSTLLEGILSGSPDFFALGELMFLWDGRLQKNHLCSCGNGLADCEFWKPVVSVTLDHQDEIPNYDNLRRSIYKNAWELFLSIIIQKEVTNPGIKNYQNITGRLYANIKAFSKANILIDSSKATFYGFFLNAIDDFDMRFVHLVRDPRGVAYSWGKKIERPETQADKELLPQWSYLKSSFEWLKHNAAAHLLQLIGAKYLRIYYEDLIKCPDITLEKIFIHADAKPYKLVMDGKVRMPINHTVAGNPVRYSRGEIILNIDDAWVKSFSLIKKIIISLCTFPLSVVYNYLSVNPPE